MLKTVTIIIPVLNGEKYVAKCFSALNRLEYGGEYSVVLADNGSTDGTLKTARGFSRNFKLDIISRPGVNISSLRNYGAAYAPADVFAFLDIDCVPSPGWLRHGVETLRENSNNRAAASGAPYKIPRDSGWVARAWDLMPSNAGAAGEADWLPSGNLFITASAYGKIGGFNEHLVTNEDFDICFRLRGAGYRIYSDPAIEAVHLGTPRTVADFFRKEMWHGKAVFRVFLGSGRELQNLKAVAYALVYVLLIAALPVSLLAGKAWYGLVILSLSALIPFSLSCYTAFSRGDYRYIPGLSALLFAYGIARALCIIDIRNLYWSTAVSIRDNSPSTKSSPRRGEGRDEGA
jgi:glycosyltransferase involved in cell wall biosynthesis